MARYIDANAIPYFLSVGDDTPIEGIEIAYKHDIDKLPTADVVEVNKISEQIIRKKAEVSDYWQNNVKSYRAMQGYSNIEHDTDNFLRVYNEAVEDILTILDGRSDA